MRRKLLDELVSWKKDDRRKPLILQGARQVGKTWLMQEFGRQEYAQVLYVNLETDERMRRLFSETLEIETILFGLETEFSASIDPDSTLIILDEIQEVPRALTALKYFQEYKIRYDVICAGSLLAVGMHEGVSFPVGKVSFLELFPLCFEEFLEGVGEHRLAALLDQDNHVLLGAFRDKLINLLKTYMIVGGMPEVVNEFRQSGSFARVRELQRSLIKTYENDFSKHAPGGEIPRILQVWRSLPAQLSREQKKFTYGLIKHGARAKEYEKAIVWLQQAGLIHKIQRVTKPAVPLSAYEDLKAFKLFYLDLGLMGAMSGLQDKIMLEGNDLFTEFKGAMTEQFIIQEMKAILHQDLWYWSAERAAAEVDALIEFEGDVIPVEIKSEENLKSKSLRAYADRFSPFVAIRTSLSDYREEEWLCNIPLYLISKIERSLLRYRTLKKSN